MRATKCECGSEIERRKIKQLIWCDEYCVFALATWLSWTFVKYKEKNSLHCVHIIKRRIEFLTRGLNIAALSFIIRIHNAKNLSCNYFSNLPIDIKLKIIEVFGDSRQLETNIQVVVYVCDDLVIIFCISISTTTI